MSASVITQDFLERLQARDHAAQRELRRLWFPRVQAVCRRVLGEKTKAEQAAADIWMDFTYDAIDRIEHASKAAGYLKVMTVRRCVRLRELDGRYRAAVDGADPSPGPDAIFLGVEEAVRASARLRRCLERLNQRSRDVVRMRYAHGQNQVEIGESLGVSKQYVGRVLKKSLEQLRKCLEHSA